MPPIDFTRRTALYRLFDSNGRLLYVGIAFDPEARWKSHAIEKTWWGDVTERRVDWLPTRADALLAEVAAIKAEAPIYNIKDVDQPCLRPVSRKPGVAPQRVIKLADDDWAAYEQVCKEKGVARATDIRMYVLREVAAWRRRQKAEKSES